MSGSRTGALNVVAMFFTGSRIGMQVGAVLGRAVQRAVRVDGRVAAVAGDQVVQVVLLVHPVAQRDDDVALDALRPLRLGERQFALGDAVGPVAVVGERRVAQGGQLVRSSAARLPRLHAAHPGVGTERERAERRGIVRVDCWPSWWQPMQPLFFMALSHGSAVDRAGMLLLPPN